MAHELQYAEFTVGAFVVQKNMTDVVLELVLLRGEKVSSHAHQMEYFYLLGVPLRISDKHPHPPLGHSVQTIYIQFFFHSTFKAGVHLKDVFWLAIMVLIQISCSCFKQSKIPMLISHIYVSGFFVKFLVIFGYIWG